MDITDLIVDQDANSDNLPEILKETITAIVNLDAEIRSKTLAGMYFGQNLAREPTFETQSLKSSKVATNSDPIPTNSDPIPTKSKDAETRDPILEMDLKGIPHPPYTNI